MQCKPMPLAALSLSALIPVWVEMVSCDREEGLQREVRDLEQRCQAAEARHQDLAANIPEATRPLLRQLEAMQVNICPNLPVRKSLTAVKLYRCVLPSNCVDQSCKKSHHQAVQSMQSRPVGMDVVHLWCMLLPAVQSSISNCHSVEKCTWWNALAHMKEELCHRLEAAKLTCTVYLSFANRANLQAQSVYCEWQSYSIVNQLLPRCGASWQNVLSTQKLHLHCSLTAELFHDWNAPAIPRQPLQLTDKTTDASATHTKQATHLVPQSLT